MTKVLVSWTMSEKLEIEENDKRKCTNYFQKFTYKVVTFTEWFFLRVSRHSLKSFVGLWILRIYFWWCFVLMWRSYQYWSSCSVSVATGVYLVLKLASSNLRALYLPQFYFYKFFGDKNKKFFLIKRIFVFNMPLFLPSNLTRRTVA